MNNVVRSIKKFKNEQMIHRSWNSISNNYTSIFKIGENNFLMYVFSRGNPRKVYKYTSVDGINWGNLESTTFLNALGTNFEANANNGFSDRLDVSSGYFENGNLYMVLNSRSNSGFNVGYYIVKSDVSSNYRTFVEVKYILVNGALDSSPMLQKFKGKYYIFGRYRGSQDWGSNFNNSNDQPADDSEKLILQDRRAVRVNSADSIEGQWSEVGVNINNNIKTSYTNNILDPQKFYKRYQPNTYEQSQIKGDYYGFVSYDADGNLIGVADTYFKNLNRPIILRKDRSFIFSIDPITGEEIQGPPVFGTGEEYPTLMITKNLDFTENGIPFKAVADQSGNLTRTFAPNSAKRSINSLTYDIPSAYEKSQGFAGDEFGQFKPLMLVDAGDDILFYYANRIDTHYRTVTYGPDSYLNKANENEKIQTDSSYLVNGQLVNNIYTKEKEGLAPNSASSPPPFSYQGWYDNRISQIRSARGLNNTFDPEYEWVTITNRNIIKDFPSDYRTTNETNANEAYQKPTWIYVSSIKKNRFASWKKNNVNLSAHVDTKTLTIPANADYIEINHIGNITVSIIQGGVIVDTIGPATGDNIGFQLSIPSAYKGQNVKLRFNLLNTDSELFAFNFARIKTQEQFKLLVPTPGITVPLEWSVFKWAPVNGEISGTTTYTVGVTGNVTTNNVAPLRVRVRTSLPVGVQNTVLSSLNPTDNSPLPFSITIQSALISHDNTQITFLRSQGVSEYRIEFATDEAFTNMLQNTIVLTQQVDINGLYPSTQQTANLSSLNLPVGTYWWRMRAVVPGAQMELRDPSLSRQFTVVSQERNITDWQPVLLSPANNTTINKADGVLVIDNKDDIGDTDYGKAGFQVQLSTVSDFSSNTIIYNRRNSGRVSADGSQFSIGVFDIGEFPLGQTTTRYWRVRAYIDPSVGPYSQWSQGRRVTVVG
jgi:hypothetical protein